MPAIRTIEDLKDRCVVDDITGCWEWKGAVVDGRPAVWNHFQRIRTNIGRLIGSIKSGKAIPSKVVWYCTCGNNLCANPEHYKRGTFADAQRHVARTTDIYQRPTRLANLARNRMEMEKLTHEQRMEIAGSVGRAQDIAERYGVTKDHVNKLRRYGGRTRPSASIVSSVFAWRP